MLFAYYTQLQTGYDYNSEETKLKTIFEGQTNIDKCFADLIEQLPFRSYDSARYLHLRSLTPSLLHSLPPSLTRSLAHSLTHSLTHLHLRSLYRGAGAAPSSDTLSSTHSYWALG